MKIWSQQNLRQSQHSDIIFRGNRYAQPGSVCMHRFRAAAAYAQNVPGDALRSSSSITHERNFQQIMIDKRLVPFGGLKKEPFSGSHHGMRYLLAGDDGKNSTTFTAYVYPEPWCFEQTPEDQKESATFPLSEEGMDQAMAWLNERFETEKKRWLQAAQDTMHTIAKKV